MVEFSRKTLQTLDFWRKTHKTKTRFVFFQTKWRILWPVHSTKTGICKKKDKKREIVSKLCLFRRCKKMKTEKNLKKPRKSCVFSKKTTRSFSLIFEKKWAKVEWIWFYCFCLTVQAKSSQVRQFFAKNTQNSSLFDPQKNMFFVMFFMIMKKKMLKI